MVCDFCSAPDPVVAYACRSFDATLPENATHEHRMIGAWVACQPCRELIDAGDREGLVARSEKRWHEKHPGEDAETSDLVRPWIERLHDGFFAHRTGRSVEL
jgi:hypothetical protein